MDTIDVHDLPEPLAQILQQVVNTMREALHKGKPTQHVELPLWPGVAPPPEQLRREELYRDVGYPRGGGHQCPRVCA